jgi:hypothetical protein
MTARAMTDTDTSTKAVERLAQHMESAAPSYKATADCCGETCSAGVCAAPACSFGGIMAGLQDGAATLRALLAERNRLREALREIAWAKDDGRPGPDLRSSIYLARAALKETGHE